MDTHLHPQVYICAIQHSSINAHVHKSPVNQACSAAMLLGCLTSCRYLISISWEVIRSWLKGVGHNISISLDQDLTTLRSWGWQWRCEKGASVIHSFELWEGSWCKIKKNLFNKKLETMRWKGLIETKKASKPGKLMWWMFMKVFTTILSEG